MPQSNPAGRGITLRCLALPGGPDAARPGWNPGQYTADIAGHVRSSNRRCIFDLIFSTPIRRMIQTMSLPTDIALERKAQIDPRRSLAKLLSKDLDFHRDASNYASHALHAFAAKFPPQLPRLFIEGLTVKGETVMDPMMGSGTAIVESFLCGRRAVGFDIDPLALMICRVKTHPVDFLEATWAGQRVVSSAIKLLQRAQP